MTRIVGIVVVVVLVLAGAVWLNSRAKNHAATGGEVFAHEPGPEKINPRPKPEEVSAHAAQVATQPEVQTTTPAQAQAGQPNDAMVPPVSDSVARNPPNGMLFAGRGKYQLYRQGDLTWRLNTDTGQACIIFATDAQWQQPRIFRDGCGPS